MKTKQNEIPKVGKTYNCFDDGKISHSRVYTVDVVSVIPFLDIDDKTKEIWLECVDEINWLFSSNTDYFIKTDNGEDGEAIFVRTICGGWYSIGGWLNSGRLDIDGKMTKILNQRFPNIGIPS